MIHAFADGHSRYILGMKASNNNRAETVLELFLELVRKYGVPSRARGDHGGENILVARWMEQVRGEGRGSYLWGPYVQLFMQLVSMLTVTPSSVSQKQA